MVTRGRLIHMPQIPLFNGRNDTEESVGEQPDAIGPTVRVRIAPKHAALSLDRYSGQERGREGTDAAANSQPSAPSLFIAEIGARFQEGVGAVPHYSKSGSSRLGSTRSHGHAGGMALRASSPKTIEAPQALLTPIWI